MRDHLSAVVRRIGSKYWMRLVLGSLLATFPMAAGADPAKTYGPLYVSSPSGGWGCGSFLPSLFSGTYNITYIDQLPAGAKITNVKVDIPMSQSSGNSSTPVVGVTLNGQTIGNSTGVGNFTSCPLSSDLTTYTFERLFPQPLSPYYVKGSNTLAIWVSATCYAGWGSQCGITYAGATLTLSYTTGVEAYVQSGDAQTGAVGGPTELPLVVRLASADPSTTIPGKTVEFKVTTQPSRANGMAIGADESATGITYTVQADAQGLARATLLLGDKPGTYTVEASSPLSNTNVPAKFTFTAVTPASIRIARRDEGMSDDVYQNPYLVLPMQGARFRAIGFDSAGARIGPVRTDWKTNVPKNATNPGGATLSPSMANSFTNLAPTAFGDLTLGATTNPRISGVSAASAEVKISTSLFLHFEGAFNPVSPQDQLPKFVPGSRLDGTSLPVPANSTTPLQQVELHILTPPNSTGAIKFALNPSSYRGIAMNWPATGGLTDEDMYFLDAGQRTLVLPSVPFDSSGDTKVILYVNDYAAHATLTITVSPTQRTPYTIGPLRLPIDANGNDLPDTGWSFGSGVVSDASVTSSADADQDPVVTAPPNEGIAGDGLIALEEYRGFVVSGNHRRLNPTKKDVLVIRDATLDPQYFDQLPLTIHYLAVGEAQYLSGGDESPQVNPNMVAGGTIQRGIRIKLITGAAPYREAGGNLALSYDIFGFTFPDGVSTTAVPYELPPSTAMDDDPNGTQVCHVYVDSHMKQVMLLSGTEPADPNASICGQHSPPCDVLQDGKLYPGRDGWQTDAVGDDEFATELPESCGSVTLVPVPDADTAKFIATTVAHEAAHAVDVEHNTTECGVSIMGASPYIITLPTVFTATDQNQLRIHKKH